MSTFLENFFTAPNPQTVEAPPLGPVVHEPAPSAALSPPDEVVSDPVLERPAPEGTFHFGKDGQLYRVKKGNWKYAGAKDKEDYAALKNPPSAEPAKAKAAPAPEPDEEVVVHEIAPKGKKAAPPVPTKPEPVAVATPQKAPAEVEGSPTGSGLHLYHRAVPSVAFKSLDAFVQEVWVEASKAVAAKLVPPLPPEYADLRIIKHELTDYGAWKGYFAVAIRKNAPTDGHWVLFGTSDEAMIAFEALALDAATVTRGV